jgi:hypothetical protein
MYHLGMSNISSDFSLIFLSKVLRNSFHSSFSSYFVSPFLLLLLLTLAFVPSIFLSPYYGFLNKRVRYAMESATARYPIIVIKLAMVEAMKGE